MAIDPRIPLMGQQPNFLATIGQANQMAAQQNEVQHQNAFRQFMQESGPGVFRGETAALEGLSRFDPNAAFSIKAQQERLQLARAAAARAASNAKTRAAAEAGIAEAKKDYARLGAALASGDQETWNAISQKYNLNSPFSKQGLELAGYMVGSLEQGFIEGVTGAAGGPSPDYKVVGNMLYDLNAEGGPAVVGQGGSTIPTFSFNQGADGSTSVTYGPQGEPDRRVIETGDLNKGEALTPGGIEIIPGSQLEREALASQAQKANKDEESLMRLGTTLSSIQLNINEIEDGGAPVTGVLGEARQTGLGRLLTGESAVEVQNRTNQITDSAALAEIQRMRDNSKTGGAVGQLTDSERVAIGNAVTALSTATSPREYVRAAKAYRKLALDLAYGEGNWEIQEDTGTVQFRVQEGRKPIAQMQVNDLMKLDVNTLSLEEVKQMDQRLKELGY